MWKKIGYTIVVILATLGVLFIILLLLPEDEEEYSGEKESISASEGILSEKYDEGEEDYVDHDDSDEEESEADQNDQDSEDRDDSDDIDDPEDNSDDEEAILAEVSIPESEISDEKFSFKTSTLENEEVSEKIFYDYDLTIVLAWGTYCSSCLEEMEDYSALYEELPENINVIGIVCDTYDGIDRNVDEANEILDEAGASFANIRVSDSAYDIVSQFSSIPTSFFVDGEGHLVGDYLVGSDIENTRKELGKYVKY